MNSLLLDALRCQNNSRPPVWLMRQAGRFLPEYQALRKKHSLWEMFHIPEIAVQVTQLPVDILQVDAAIVFSDILVLAEAFGHRMIFPDTGGPRIEPPITSAEDIERLQEQDMEERLQYVFETIRLLRPQLSVPLIGFCGGPFTLASYMIEGGGNPDFPKTRAWLKQDPGHFHLLLKKITEASIHYLKLQVAAGAQALQVFDSWANLLTDAEFSEFSLAYLKQISAALKQVPLILFCRHSSLRAGFLAEAYPAAISLDWHQEMSVVRKQVPKEIALQGNLNPDILKKSPSDVIAATTQLLKAMKEEKGFIANLGHGVLPDTPVDNVRAFVDTVRLSSC